MKVAIPTLDDRGLEGEVSPHFGQAAFHTIVDMETGAVCAKANNGQHFGGAMRPAEVMLQLGIDAVLCSGLGQRAVRLFQDAGIAVFCGAEGTVQTALSAYREGKLLPATESTSCPGHGHEH